MNDVTIASSAMLVDLPTAKAGYYLWIDADGRKRGERTGNVS